VPERRDGAEAVTAAELGAGDGPQDLPEQALLRLGGDAAKVVEPPDRALPCRPQQQVSRKRHRSPLSASYQVDGQALLPSSGRSAAEGLARPFGPRLPTQRAPRVLGLWSGTPPRSRSPPDRWAGGGGAACECSALMRSARSTSRVRRISSMLASWGAVAQGRRQGAPR